MHYRRLGRTELMVAEVGLGTASLDASDHDGTVAAVTAALDADVSLVEFDASDAAMATAIGEAVAQRRLHVMLVATGDGDIAELEAAAAQPGVGRIDGYLLQPAAADALPALRSSGLCDVIGVAAPDAAAALEAVERGGIDVVQLPYAFGGDDPGAVIDAATEAGIAVLGCSPLAGGALIGGDAGVALDAFCEGEPRTRAQAAIAWALTEPRLAAVVAGARNVEQAAENAEASRAAPLPTA